LLISPSLDPRLASRVDIRTRDVGLVSNKENAAMANSNVNNTDMWAK